MLVNNYNLRLAIDSTLLICCMDSEYYYRYIVQWKDYRYRLDMNNYSNILYVDNTPLHRISQKQNASVTSAKFSSNHHCYHLDLKIRGLRSLLHIIHTVVTRFAYAS